MNYLWQESAGRDLRRYNEDEPEALPAGVLEGQLAAGTFLAQAVAIIVVLGYVLSRLWLQ